jgi:PAS domain S-box-containing protein
MSDKPTYEELELKVREFKKLEAELIESQRRLSTVFDTIALIAVMLDRTGNIIFCNDYLLRLTGWKSEDVLGKSWFAIFLPDDVGLSTRYEVFDKMIETGDFPKHYENDIVTKAGERRLVRWNNSVFYDLDGRVETVTSIGEDITNYKKAETALKESEAKYRMIAENTSDFIWILDLETMRLSYASPSVIKVTGYTVEEHLNKPLDMILERESLDKIMKVLSDGLKRDAEGQSDEEITERLEWQEYHKDGHLIWVEAETAFIRDEYEKPKQVVGITRDITDRKKAEETLQDSEERYRQIFTIAPAGIYEVDFRTGKLVNANNDVCEYTGYTRDELLSMNGTDLLTEESQEKFLNRISKVLSGERVIDSVDYEMIKKDGSVIWVNLNTRLLYEGENIVGATVIAQDITQQKALESQLRQALKMESIGTLAGGIAHDFNNILSVILGNTELAIDDTPEWSPTREYLTQTRKASLRAKDVVKQLLTFTRKSDEQQKPIKISTVAKESLRLLRSSIPTNIELNHKISDDCYTIKADSTQIHQVMINIVTNSSHAIESNGKIDLELENVTIGQKQITLFKDLQSGNYVRLLVRDTGSGIAPEDLEKIFDPYFTTKEFGKGTGMGLALVHGIVESHNGSIKLDSEVGHGTTISIYFPAIQAEIVKDAISSTQIPIGTENILIIDDEEPIAILNQRRLERLGYSAESCTDPHEALQLIQNNPNQFDLVITDMAMPKMTGAGLANEIREINPDLPVILCTGYSDKIDEDKAKKIGIKGYLMKPFEKKHLADTVREVLDEK